VLILQNYLDAQTGPEAGSGPQQAADESPEGRTK
jgi:hypothetical protein